MQCIDKIIPFRMDEHEELLGADYAEHNIHHPGVGVTRDDYIWPGIDHKLTYQVYLLMFGKEIEEAVLLKYFNCCQGP